MKNTLLPLIFCLLVSIPAYSQKKIITGFDGGMMIHAGYVRGDITPLGYHAEGCPLGVGGVIRLHLGEHWRIGAEGYVSTLRQLDNGSYIKSGWGGVLGDFYWTLGRFAPYAGLTIGGGSTTDLLMMEKPEEEWARIGNTYYHSQAFMAIDLYVGCDFIVSDAFHMTLKADWLNCVGKELHVPTGPRFSVGFIFFH